jgi:uncharacterized protein (TIGR04551 family)
MPRFSLTSPIALALALAPSLALGQTPPAATAPAGAPSGPAPSTNPPASGSNPQTGGRAAPSAGSIDRGSLIEPPAVQKGSAAAGAQGATPAEARDTDRARDVSIGANPKEIYAEDWWVRSHPVLEFHGYLRLRAELFHGFALGRADSLDNALWPQPADNSYTEVNGTVHPVVACGDNGKTPCDDKSQAGANMRFRVNPELHISDNVRVLSQIDMLDNLVLGSTPGGYANQPGTSGGYEAANPNPYVPKSFAANTQVPPTAGVNSFQNSIVVKRAWGEYATPLGQLRFGRMPSHWGLGILENSGDGYDSDWQSTVDRIMFTTGIKALDLYFSGAWDFPNEGTTSATVASTLGGQPYDLAQLDDVNQYVAMVARRRAPELAKLDLAKGNVVLNGGAYFAYRDQYIADEGVPLGTSTATVGGVATRYQHRGFKQYVPDLWVQLLYKKFRFEAEGVMVAGSGQNIPGANSEFKLRQFGVASQTEFRAIEDRLRLQFGFGWASGDAGLLPELGGKTTLSPSRAPGSTGIYPNRVYGDNTYSEFRFHPDYRIDLILHRNILGRVQGDYYFRPSVDYDFTRSAEGQKLGGGAAIIWTRASEFIQSPGHKRDLGLEFDLSLYYQSKDGAMNDNPDKMGGFFTMLQYGVLFPLGGLSHLSTDSLSGVPDTSTAHMLRWFIGILY